MKPEIKNKIAWVCGVGASIATIIGVYLAADGPTIATDRDIKAVSAQLELVASDAKKNRLRILYAELNELYRRLDEARRAGNEALVSELQERIRDKKREIEEES